VASVGVLLGLVLIRFTGWQEIDPIVAFGVAIYITLIAITQVRKALQELADTQLPDSEVQQIWHILEEFDQRYIDAHELRTRKSGRDRHMDFHLTVCKELTVEQSHDLCDDIERRMVDRFPHASVSIHVEPCEHERTECNLTCPVFKAKGK
jgi:cation diffusion facilitator family transporter